MKGRVLVPGSAQGQLLRLDQPVSFWGGVDPANGRITATGHPQQGQCVNGRILALERCVGSSSGSSILLELLAGGHAPAAILLAEADQILVLGAVVGRELGFPSLPVLQVARTALWSLPDWVRILPDGTIESFEKLP